MKLELRVDIEEEKKTLFYALHRGIRRETNICSTQNFSIAIRVKKKVNGYSIMFTIYLFFVYLYKTLVLNSSAVRSSAVDTK